MAGRPLHTLPGLDIIRVNPYQAKDKIRTRPRMLEENAYTCSVPETWPGLHKDRSRQVGFGFNSTISVLMGGRPLHTLPGLDIIRATFTRPKKKIRTRSRCRKKMQEPFVASNGNRLPLDKIQKYHIDFKANDASLNASEETQGTSGRVKRPVNLHSGEFSYMVHEIGWGQES